MGGVVKPVVRGALAVSTFGQSELVRAGAKAIKKATAAPSLGEPPPPPPPPADLTDAALRDMARAMRARPGVSRASSFLPPVGGYGRPRGG